MITCSHLLYTLLTSFWQLFNINSSLNLGLNFPWTRVRVLSSGGKISGVWTCCDAQVIKRTLKMGNSLRELYTWSDPVSMSSLGNPKGAGLLKAISKHFEWQSVYRKKLWGHICDHLRIIWWPAMESSMMCLEDLHGKYSTSWRQDSEDVGWLLRSQMKSPLLYIIKSTRSATGESRLGR